MKKITLALLALIFCNQTFAGVPFTFEAGKPARASEVNDNFNSLDSAIDDLQGDLFTLNLFATGTSNDLSSLNSTVSDLNSEVVTLDDAVIANTEDISLLDSAISEIESAISSIESAITDLDERVTTLEDATPASSDKCAPTERKTYYNDKINYVYQSATVGSLLSIGSGTDNYRLVKFPVKDVVTGKIFFVTFPTRVQDGVLQMEYYFSSDTFGTCAEDITIAGYPASVEINEYFSYNKSFDEIQIENQTGISTLKIKLGNILLISSLNIAESIDPVVIDPSAAGYDLTGLDLSAYVTSDSAFTTLNELISYIKIEEVEP